MQTLKCLKSIAHRHYLTQVFEDFLHMTAAALCRGADEERYQAAAKRYNAEEKKEFGQALGALFMDYESRVEPSGSWDDIIGRIFEEVNSSMNSAQSGQFFTPVSLCDMMAAMVNHDIKDGCVSDPSCGSSRNLIAHSRLDANNRLKYTYFGMDLDIRCCLMSVINFVMFGMKGYVIHMNTLSMEVYGGWRIFLPETGMMVKPLTEHEAKALLVSNEIAKEKENDQLTLF